MVLSLWISPAWAAEKGSDLDFHTGCYTGSHENMASTSTMEATYSPWVFIQQVAVVQKQLHKGAESEHGGLRESTALSQSLWV